MIAGAEVTVFYASNLMTPLSLKIRKSTIDADSG